MKGKSRSYEVKCLLCGTEVGVLVDATFIPDPGCRGPLPRRDGSPRCCRCGGSLYLEPTERALLPVDRARLRRLFESERSDPVSA